MQIVRTTSEMAALAAQWRKENKTVGLVPTMGALHAGHISLVDYAKAECDIAVASVFVNPSQFGPNEDFDKYPRTEAADIEKLEAAHCDVAFIPSPARSMVRKKAERRMVKRHLSLFLLSWWQLWELVLMLQPKLRR